jgi:hypothetical protein
VLIAIEVDLLVTSDESKLAATVTVAIVHAAKTSDNFHAAIATVPSVHRADTNRLPRPAMTA